MKAILKILCILTVVCMSLITVSASAFAEATNQKVILYYPNGNWGLTPVEITLSIQDDDNVYLAALRQLTEPDTLPSDCYDEFPKSFKVEDVEIVGSTANITVSGAVFKDAELSDSWLKTLGDIISYNLFKMNEKIDSVNFSSSTQAIRGMSKVDKSDLFSPPSFELKDTLVIDLDYQSLIKLPEEERNQMIQDAIIKALGLQPLELLDQNYAVCIDPGHGGSDPGAVVDGVQEKDLNLDIALAMRDYLESSSPPYPTFNVLMTRDSDEWVSYTERHELANDNNADIFVSIHCNSYSNPSVRGVTGRYSNNHDVQLSIDLANSLINAIPPTIPKHSDASYQDIQVLRNTTMPAALIECGFMTNSSDLEILQNEGDDIGYILGLASNVWCQVNL